MTINIIPFLLAIAFYNLCEWLVKWALKKWPTRIQYRWVINRKEYIALMDLPPEQVQDFYKWSDSIPPGKDHPFAWHVEFEQFTYVPYEDQYRLQVNKAICVPVAVWEQFLAQRIEV